MSNPVEDEGPQGERGAPWSRSSPVTPLHLLLCPSSFCPNLSAISTNLKLSHNVAVSLCGSRGTSAGEGDAGTGQGKVAVMGSLCVHLALCQEKTIQRELEAAVE